MTKREQRVKHQGGALPGAMECFLSPLSAIPYLLKRPKLVALAAAPIALGAFLFVILVWLMYKFATEPILALIQIDSALMDSMLSWFVGIVLMLVVLMISALLTFLAMIPINAPFCDLISEYIEEEEFSNHPSLLAPKQPFWVGIRYAMIDGIKRMLIFCPLILILLAVGLIPLIGPLGGLILGFVYNVFFLSMDAFSYSLDRRHLRLRQKFRYLNENNQVRIPLGIGLTTMLIIPLNALILPVLSAVAGTRLYCALRTREVLNTSNQ